MIVVEGMDNSGKSTLAKYLHETLELPLEHSPKPPFMGTPVEDWLAWIEVSLTPDTSFYIYDRYPIVSEMVYGPVLRGYSLLGEDYLTRWRMANPLIVYCRPPQSRIFSFGNREQMVGIKENKERLYEAYEKYMEMLVNKTFNVTIYNFETENVSKVADLSSRHLRGISLRRVK